jgi:aryl-alcohol dehydrogenase-like predicted oxidoreductase
LSGHWSADRASAGNDFRAHLPRFTGDNAKTNLALFERLRELAAAKDCTVAQIAVAWVLARGEDIVPLVGARRRDRLSESLGALDVQLSADDMAQIEAAVPPGAARGDRYVPAQMAMLDSERP